jgi:electron-transferring-flavoprotein dehydrogenase
MSEREILEVDVLMVGAGPANLACSLHLAKLLAGRDDVMVVLIEKAKEIGFHALSGAVLDPRALAELVPDFAERDCPLEAPVDHDEIWYLAGNRKIRAPFVPKALDNRGLFVCSLGKLTRWMAGLVEATGQVQLFPEFPGAELLVEDGKVVGVRTGDKGVDKHGEKKGNYEPGIDIRAKVTVLGEGARGSLTKSLARQFGLAGANPQVYAIGVKELWQMPAGRVPPGRVYHTMGWPHDRETFGGGFIYGMKGDVWDLGLVTGLDYRHPYTDPHGLFQTWKTHPAVRALLDGGKMIQYGAKTIPEGGLYSVLPDAVDGCLVIGDSAGYLNPLRLKGIHLAMKSGMLAAETIAEALAAGDVSAKALAAFRTKVEASWIHEELRASRNIHQGFEGGFVRGMANALVSIATKGRGLHDRMPMHAGHERIRTLAMQFGANPPPFVRMKCDGALTFDRLSGIYESGTKHEEDQPCHLVVADTEICRTRCVREYGNPCTRFCPAEVYEMEDDPARGGLRLKINASNCVHCKTCDIMDPYQVINWVTPEGGGGPRYTNL